MSTHSSFSFYLPPFCPPFFFLLRDAKNKHFLLKAGDFHSESGFTSPFLSRPDDEGQAVWPGLGAFNAFYEMEKMP